MSEWRKLYAYLTGKRNISLLVHEKPDGDCLGSALALGLFLSQLGFSPTLFLPEPLPQIYGFLPGSGLLKIVDDPVFLAGEPIIAIDCADRNRFGYEIPPGIPLLNIDHHASNDYYGDYNWVDTKAAATGEIIYRLICGESSGRARITPEIATCLYVALATDTGSFTYSNLTRQTFAIAGELVELKADLNQIRHQLYEKRPLSEIIIVKEALTNLELHTNGKILSCAITYEQLQKEDLFTTETDNLLNMMRSIEGVELALLLKEIKPRVVKVSLRSKTFLDVNKLAGEYQGGGHPRAAGCTVNMAVDEVLRNLIARAEKALKAG